jgi:Domain of unknown function (DUF4919)
MTNKIKTFGLLLFLTIVQFAFGQATFNYQKDFKTILEKTKDPNDNLSYDKLLKQFTSNDTTMADFEVLALLIGYTDKPEFKPYDYLSKEREIYELNGEGKYQEALDTASLFLQKHPVSQQALIEKSYSYYKLGNKDSADYYSYQFRRIMEAMYFSGNGTTKETPTFALGPADGQNYVQKFIGAKIGTMGSGHDNYGNFLDILEAELEDGKTISLHFIIQHATDKMFGGKSIEEELNGQKKKKKNK